MSTYVAFQISTKDEGIKRSCKTNANKDVRSHGNEMKRFV